MAEDRLNVVLDWIDQMEGELAQAVPAADESDAPFPDLDMDSDCESMGADEASAFENRFTEALLGDSESTAKFKEKLQNAIDAMPAEKQKWFHDPGHTIETLEDIFERYRTDFSMKVALGAARHAAGETDIKNSGYQAGSALVSETTKGALDLLCETVCQHDIARATTLLGVTISCSLSAMGDLTPKNESLMLPEAMKIEPQVTFLSPENRTPERIIQLIEEVSNRDWTRFKEKIFRKSHAELLEESKGRDSGGMVYL